MKLNLHKNLESLSLTLWSDASPWARRWFGFFFQSTYIHIFQWSFLVLKLKTKIKIYLNDPLIVMQILPFIWPPIVTQNITKYFYNLLFQAPTSFQTVYCFHFKSLFRVEKLLQVQILTSFLFQAFYQVPWIQDFCHILWNISEIWWWKWFISSCGARTIYIEKSIHRNLL